MDVSQLVQQKLNELGLEQRDLADAAEVTESNISRLLNLKKMPPAPDRTDIYDLRNSSKIVLLLFRRSLGTCCPLWLANAHPGALNETGGTDEGRRGQNSNNRFY